MADPYAAFSSPVQQVAPQGQSQDPYASFSSPVQKPTGLDDVGKSLGLGARNVMEGLGGVTDVISQPYNAVLNYATGSKNSTSPGRDTVDKLADQLGLPNAIEPGSRIVGQAISGATTGLATGGAARLLTGAPGAVRTIAKALASSPILDTLSGAASGASQQGAAEAGAGPWGQMAAGLAGGFAPSAVHIAAHAAGIPSGAPQFISDLFNQRGVDTTPSNDPRASPLSNRGMSPEQQAAYHQVLASGTADDINNFYAQSKLPTPDSTKVDRWVTYRDGVPEGYAQPEYQPPMPSNQDIHRSNIEQHINDQTANWKNSPDFEVVPSPKDIADPAVRAQAVVDDGDKRAVGLFGSDGKVRIFSDRVSSPDQVNAVLYHEALGHYGLAQQFGDRLESTLLNLDSRNVGGFKKDVDTRAAANPGESRALSAEEVLAEKSQDGPLPKSLSDAMSGHINNFARKMGLKVGYSDGEVRNILRQAHDAVINGKGRDVSANGYRGTDFGSNKFMFTGRKATGFDPEHASAFTPSDGLVRNEISDHGATLKDMHDDSSYKLGNVLDHPELYKQYPFLKDTKVNHIDMSSDNMHGSYDNETKEINVNQNSPEKLQTILHETQHAIQDHEGYAGVQNYPKDMSEDEYNRNPIEKEAFATEARKIYTPAERQMLPAKFMRKPPIDLADHYGTKDEPEYQEHLRRYLTDLKSFTDTNQNEISDFQRIVKRVDDANQAHPNMPERTRQQHADAVWDKAEPLFDKVNQTFNYLHPNDRDSLISALHNPYDFEEHQDWLNDHLDQHTSKFMKMDQFQASKPGYKAEQELNDSYKGLLDNYKPESISWEETRQSALDLGITGSQIRRLSETNPGDLTTRVWRTNTAANMALSKIEDLNTRLGTHDWTAGDQITYGKAIADFTYFAAKAKGDTSEAARALNAAKAFSAYHNNTLEQIAAALHEQDNGIAGLMDDPAKFMKFAQDIKQQLAVGNPKGAQATMQMVNKPHFLQWITSVHMSGMLFSLSTQVKAPIDMAKGLLNETIAKAVAIPIGPLRQTISAALGKKPGQGVTPAELMMHIYGMGKATADLQVYKAVIESAKTGQGSLVTRDANQRPVVTPTNNNMATQMGSAQNPRIPVLSKAMDLISAHDTLFRSVGVSSQLYALGTRRAAQELGKGASIADVTALGSSYALTPSDKMMQEATDLTNRNLLLNRNILNGPIDWAKTKGGPIGQFVVGNLAPFVRVEMNNLMTRIIARSPLAFLDKFTMGELKAGGARADIALAKIAIGTTAFGLAWAVADHKKGPVSSEGPANVDKFKEAEAGGWSGHSVYENGQYTTGNTLGASINPWDQHNATAMIAADMRDAYERGVARDYGKGWIQQVGTGMKLGLGAMIHGLSDTSWVQDIDPIMEALSAKGDQAEPRANQFAASEAKSFIPAQLGQVARWMDPTRHDVIDPHSISASMGNAMMAQIPGLTGTSPTKYSVYGDPLQNGQGVINVHTPIPGLSGSGTKATTDPTEIEMERLASTTPKAIITPVTRITFPDQTKESQVQLEERQKETGQQIRYAVQQLIADPRWSQTPDTVKIQMLRDIQREQKSAVKDKLYGQ